MPDLSLRFHTDVIIVDGALGTMLQQEEVPTDESPLLLNVLDPELIADIHRRYLMAGAQALTTNSFGGTRAKLAEYGLAERTEELNRAAVRIARSQNPEHVLADMGPCGLLLEPLGPASFDEVFALYAEQARALASEHPDALLIETMADIADARCALLAARSVCDLPVFVTCTFDATGHMELSGTSPEAAAVILEACGASVIGMNCGLGPAELLPLAQRMAQATTLPLMVQPNAGIPSLNAQGKTVFPGTPDEMATIALKLREAGVQFIGSCCGSTPTYTGALFACVGKSSVVARRLPQHAGKTVLASPRQVVTLGAGEPLCLIGERINPTGKPVLTAELERGVLSELLAFAAEQEANGAAVLDVNVGAPAVDQLAVLPQAVNALSAATPLPLSIDTTDPSALEAALKAYPGRALINSVNGEEASLAAVLPLARRYGAALVALTLDESGIPATIDGRLAIVERIRARALAEGLSERDLLFDVLTMTTASDPEAPQLTLQTLAAISEQGLHSVLGVSNVSHGLPLRPELNAAFTRAARASGLTAAIANPNEVLLREALAEDGGAGVGNATIRTHDERGGSGERGEAYNAAPRSTALAAWQQVLARAFDHAATTSAAQADARAQTQQPMTSISSAAAPTPPLSSAVVDKLRRAVLRGDRAGMPALIDAVVAEGVDPSSIVESILTPVLQGLGEDFGVGKAFLPQMMMAAGAMKVAVERIRELLPAQETSTSAGKVLFCTVKGDVHSIGKDICVALLESQGFEVIDLGVDVSAEEIIEVAKARDVDVVCLSALMTTTLPNMRETVAALYRELPNFNGTTHRAVAVGGAVVTQSWAENINARYAPDAPSCVTLVQGICAQL